MHAAGHGVVAVDLPVDDDASGLAEYAAVALDAIGGLGDLVVVAQSMGAYTAAIMATRTPVDLIVLVDRYVNVLGANTAQQCLDEGVLDEILVCIAPVLLGDGVRMFDRPGGTNIKLERLSLTQAPRATNLRLRTLS